MVRDRAEGRAADAWGTATRLHFNRDFRLNSQSLAACLTPMSTLGGRAWPNFRMTDRRHETAAVLWANTTLGLMLFWWSGSVQQAGRANLTVSRLPDLPVLDPRALGDAQSIPAPCLHLTSCGPRRARRIRGDSRVRLHAARRRGTPTFNAAAVSARAFR